MVSQTIRVVHIVHLDDFVCCFAAKQPNPKKRTDLTRISIPQAFLAIRELLGTSSEFEWVYGQGVIFGGNTGEEPDQTICPSLECPVFFALSHLYYQPLIRDIAMHIVAIYHYNISSKLYW
jgi:hypothetical protein